jgi:vancomycin permeability regulator SanA
MSPSLILRWLIWKKVLLLAVIGSCLTALTICGSDAWVRRSSVYCHRQLEAVPAMPVALVLGCSPRVHGSPNLFYTHRMDAAAALYQAGKVKAFIVSGDNATHQYDEPTAMKADSQSSVVADFFELRRLRVVGMAFGLRTSSALARTGFKPVPLSLARFGSSVSWETRVLPQMLA